MAASFLCFLCLPDLDLSAFVGAWFVAGGVLWANSALIAKIVVAKVIFVFMSSLWNLPAHKTRWAKKYMSLLEAIFNPPEWEVAGTIQKQERRPGGSASRLFLFWCSCFGT